MSSATLRAGAKPTVSVPGSSLREFEPMLLGALRPRFRDVVRQIEGRRQSEIRAILEGEAGRGFGKTAGRDGLAYEATLLVLRDYVASGYYPTIAGGRLFLAALLDSPVFSERQRRTAMTSLYRSARNRALIERGSLPWLERVTAALDDSAYEPARVLECLVDGPPQIEVRRAAENNAALDARGLWRAVRATWSMGPEASAPGREVAYVVSDVRVPETPLGIIQFRNVVPEIRARDLWLGTAAGSPDARDGETGFFARLREHSPVAARERVAATEAVFRNLLEHVQTEGIGGETPREEDIPRLLDIIKSRQARYKAERLAAEPTAHEHLGVIKRAETAADLLRGLRATRALLATNEHPLNVARRDGDVARDVDAGLGKIWHYHMGFVALELSICGAAPPFGPARAGKLMAALAGAAETVRGWGGDRPLGEIASNVYRREVRDCVPNPGPLVIFTSGLFPGHSAQYNRVTAGDARWRKIGETTGFGSFHIGVDTLRALTALNEAVDGYVHISRKFGEGSGARFRAVGRALAHLGLPDLRKHETHRPLYALSLGADPGEVLLGWDQPRDTALPSAATIAASWWKRWFSPRAEQLVHACQMAPDLRQELAALTQIRG